LYAVDPGVLRIEQVHAGPVGRERNGYELHLPPANPEERDREDPPPGNFKQRDAGTAEHPPHVVHHLLGAPNGLR
jgi:hypothetical protein